MNTLDELRSRLAVAPPPDPAPPGPGPTEFDVMVAALQGETFAGLDAEFRAIEAERRRLDARQAALVGEIDRQRAWAADAHLNVKAWLRSTGNWSTAQALAATRRAHLFDLAPLAGEAAIDGRCGTAQIDELARAAANPRCGHEIVDVIDIFVNLAPKVPFDDFRAAVQKWATLADADGAHRDRDETIRRRRARLHIEQGVARLGAVGGALAGSEMEEILDAFAKAELLTDRAAAKEAGTTVLPRTDAQRRFDALRAIFLAAAATPADAKRPEPSVHLAADLGTFLEHLARLRLVELAPGYTPPDPLARHCETSRGHVLTPADIVEAMLLGTTRRIVFDSDGVVINLGRRSRFFRGGAADAVRWAARHCTHRGCDRPWVEADHLQPWHADGHTDPENGAPRCVPHNRTRGQGFRVWRDELGHWHTYRPDGTEIT